MLDNLLAEESVNSDVLTEEDKTLEPLLAEINLIRNAELRSFVRAVLLNANPNFWIMAAAKEPDQHPEDEYMFGGLVTHTKRVFRTVCLMAESQIRSIEDLDLLLAGALLHDLGKCDDSVPEYLHTIVVDKLVEGLSMLDEADPTYQDRSNVLTFIINQSESLLILMRLVRSHEGFASPIPEIVPVTSLEQILHLSNQICRNLDRIIDGLEVQHWRWIQNDNRPKKRTNKQTPSDT